MAALSAAHYSPYSGVKRSAKAASNTTSHTAFLRGISLGMAKGFCNLRPAGSWWGRVRVSVCVLAQQQPWKKNWGGGEGLKAEGRGKSCKYENLDGSKPWWICIYATSHYKIFMMLTHNNCYHREETLSSSIWLCKHFYKHTEMDTEHFLCCSFFKVITQQRQKYCFSPQPSSAGHP